MRATERKNLSRRDKWHRLLCSSGTGGLKDLTRGPPEADKPARGGQAREGANASPHTGGWEGEE